MTPIRDRENGALRRGIANTLLVLFSVVVGFVATELLYRGYVIWKVEPRKPPDLLHVSWPAPFTFRSYGYDYGPPSGTLVRAELLRDESQPYGYRLASVTRGTYEKYGNYPAVYSDHRANGAYRDTDYDKADLKILAFGDSFTAGSWPDLVQYQLEQKTGLKVRILNFGRDFFGVNQMVDAAAHHVTLLKPDMFIIAFITADLSRPRTWRGVTTKYGYHRVFISVEESPQPSSDAVRALGDAALVSPLAEDLFKEYLETSKLPSSGDERVRMMVEQARTFYNESLRQPRLTMFNLTRSYLFDRLWHGNVFRSVRTHPLLEIDDFRKDPRMVDAIGKLNESGIPYQLIHLPRYDFESREKPVVFGVYGYPARQEQKLMQSLKELSGRDIFFVGAQLPMLASQNHLMVSPADAHPNKAGAALYAAIISDRIIATMKLRRIGE